MGDQSDPTAVGTPVHRGKRHWLIGPRIVPPGSADLPAAARVCAHPRAAPCAAPWPPL